MNQSSRFVYSWFEDSHLHRLTSHCHSNQMKLMRLEFHFQSYLKWQTWRYWWPAHPPIGQELNYLVLMLHSVLAMEHNLIRRFRMIPMMRLSRPLNIEMMSQL